MLYDWNEEQEQKEEQEVVMVPKWSIPVHVFVVHVFCFGCVVNEVLEELCLLSKIDQHIVVAYSSPFSNGSVAVFSRWGYIDGLRGRPRPRGQLDTALIIHAKSNSFSFLVPIAVAQHQCVCVCFFFVFGQCHQFRSRRGNGVCQAHYQNRMKSRSNI